MENTRKIFAYCERGQDPGFWAEPFNAITNFAFILGAVVVLWLLWRRPSEESKTIRYLLILNLAVIGIGSFLFHTYATRWASAADVIPIGIFMLAFFAYALYVFARLPIIVVIIALTGFAYLIRQAAGFDCHTLGIDLEILERTNCLNGSFGYLPALAAMLFIGAWLGIRRHPAAPYILGAGLVFIVSIGFRASDWILCRDIWLLNEPRGTHFLWHILNSVVLFLLLLSAVFHGGRRNLRVDADSDTAPARTAS